VSFHPLCEELSTITERSGGLTKTHALLSHSPAIDISVNPADLQEEQRGRLLDMVTPPLPFLRVSRLVTDIGAFEVQQNDEIFATEFEGCP